MPQAARPSRQAAGENEEPAATGGRQAPQRPAGTPGVTRLLQQSLDQLRRAREDGRGADGTPLRPGSHASSGRRPQLQPAGGPHSSSSWAERELALTTELAESLMLQSQALLADKALLAGQNAELLAERANLLERLAFMEAITGEAGAGVGEDGPGGTPPGSGSGRAPPRPPPLGGGRPSGRR